MLILGAAPTTRWILADAAPDLDRSLLVIRRAADHGEHLRGLGLEHVSIVDFDVEAEQGLCVGGPDIEPPGWKAHRHAIEVIDLSPFRTVMLLDRAHHRRRVLDFGVDLTRAKTVIQRR